MRPLLPLWSSLVAVLLLLQWSGGAVACLQRQGPAAVLCHVAGADQPTPSGPDAAGHMAGCPVCAPLPPGFLPVPPAIAAPRPLPSQRASLLPLPEPAAISGRPSPHQPRAPPRLS